MNFWTDDPESISPLQEIFGLCLTGDTRQQKAFLLVGPRRSGKGTVARILARLIGADNTVAPTVAGLGSNFGLAPLIGKRVAIISEKVRGPGHRRGGKKASGGYWGGNRGGNCLSGIEVLHPSPISA